ncbi:DUF4880 domain-containing protein [Pseudomonas sp. NC26]|uniref:DUF4880 domain-containing protein n=1 Tax=Pseudomonas putida TaxID=303 RepID=A0A7W2L4A2_PSEPU|nr:MULTISPECIES: FecR domain-containing protein [Pseudomonas]MBA6118011.1 DUF4880 domain-containing protein [Pseudomonas putida]MCZ9635767.1 DUF4880 domain-containing protein [Pseudomonas putida]MEC4879132.1 DUF4880 domain-containing protein [Pseudomonas sp. NC26]QNL90002.1 Uncharacterized protein PPKH_4588 [Pseudomonas putida]
MHNVDEQQRLIEQATQWLVLLRSGQASAEDYLAFQAWRGEDPRREQLCQRLEITLGVFQVPLALGIDGQRVQRVLQAPSGRRRFLQRALVGAGVAVGVGLSLKHSPLPGLGLGADLSTRTGERQNIHLPDGSQLLLNAQSQADVRFDAQQRLLRWRGGEGRLEVVDDARPFVVHTEVGSISAQSARLLLRERDGLCRVCALAGVLEVSNLGGDRLQLRKGQGVSFDRLSFAAVLPLRGGEGAWVDGLLEVRDTPLAEVIDALRPYRQGVLRLEPAVAGLRVSGLYRLDQSDLVLEALTRTLPIKVSRYSQYWVTISAA